MKAYDSYKNTNIQWLGQIPSHWNHCQLRHTILQMTTGLNPRNNFVLTKEDEYFYVTIRNFKDGVLYLDDNCDRISKNAWEIIQERSDLMAGDILFASISHNGQAYLVKEDPTNWNINESVFKLRFRKHIVPMFAYYVLTSDAFYNEMASDATGSTFKSIKQNKLRANYFPVPPIEEQKAIADFLDVKTSELEAERQNILKQIDFLEELKLSIITNVVTRGLDENVELKDSGKMWIGKIPSHWEIRKIKFCVVQTKEGIKMGPFGSSLTGKVLLNRPYKVYGQWNVIGRDFTAGLGTISAEDYKDLQSFKVVPNDILISMMGTIGKCAIVPDGIQEGVMDSHIVKVRLDKRIIDSRYFMYVYDKDYTDVVYSQILMEKKGSIMDGLNSTIIKNFSLPVPPIGEQQAIADYLDVQITKINEQIELQEQQIRLIDELKQSIISQAVTGKIKAF